MNWDQISLIEDRNERHRQGALKAARYDVKDLSTLRYESKYYNKKFLAAVSLLVAIVKKQEFSY